MNFEKFTLKAQEAIRDAAAIAQRRDHASVEPEHLLSALLGQEDGVTGAMLSRTGIDRARLERALNAALEKLPKVYGEAAQVQFSPAAQKVIAKAEAESQAMRDDFVASEHMFLALLTVESRVASMLASLGLNRQTILAVLKDLRGSRKASD
ncbi:MAG: Clp protease N-terminal domain-containing protein, partial [Spirochaetales bacterium]|nr:Clp protease N-terminal domain-containing protein [Spirochaetales bacterium]